MKIEKRLYKLVAANTEESLDYVPANGEIFYPEIMGGDAPMDGQSKVVISWDADGAEEILFCTYESSRSESSSDLLGNGSKVFRILLVNNTSESKELGGYVIGQNSL